MLYIFTNFVLNCIFMQGTDMISKRFRCLGRRILKLSYVSICWEQGLKIYMC